MPALGQSDIYAYLLEAMKRRFPDFDAGGGVGGSSTSSSMRGLRAVDSPPGGPVTPGPTKTEMGEIPWLPPDQSQNQSRPSEPSGPSEEEIAAMSERGRERHTPLRFTLPGQKERTYDPFTEESPGISAYAGQGGLGRPSRYEGTGVQGHAGGGAFSPSSTPVIGYTPGTTRVPVFDWSNVANPAAFEAFHEPTLAIAEEAKRQEALMAAADPLWKERAIEEIRSGRKLIPVKTEKGQSFLTESQARDIAEGRAPAIPSPPSATIAGRIKAANDSIVAGNKILGFLEDPNIRSTVGPVLGRYNSLKAAVGAGDPVAQKLVGELKGFAALQPAVHAFRAIKFQENLEKALTTKQTPEALAALIRGILVTSHVVATGGNPDDTEEENRGESSLFSPVESEDEVFFNPESGEIEG